MDHLPTCVTDRITCLSKMKNDTADLLKRFEKLIISNLTSQYVEFIKFSNCIFHQNIIHRSTRILRNLENSVMAAPILEIMSVSDKWYAISLIKISTWGKLGRYRFFRRKITVNFLRIWPKNTICLVLVIVLC